MKNKKMIPILILLIIIVYLAIFIVKDIPKNKEENNTKIVKKEEKKEEIKKEVWKDNNPITIGLYHYDKSLDKRTLKEEYNATWEYHKDIISFNTFYTKEEEISSEKNAILFEEYVQNYEEDISNYRIGYIIEFNNEKYQILRPSDTEVFYNILEIYLYDAIAHKNDTWYSHTTDSEYNDSTLLQGIKLTAGKNISDITTDIKVTVFSYDEDDFDENNNYKGKCSYSVIVKKA